MTYVFRLFDFWKFFLAFAFSPFSFLFAAVIDLLLGLLAVKKLLRERHRDGQFSPCSSQVPIVQRLDNAIHRINRYPVDKCLQNKPSYPLDSDLSSG